MSLPLGPHDDVSTPRPINDHQRPLAKSNTSTVTLRTGKCIECPATISIRGRGKLPLRCGTCRVQHRRLSNRLSQRRFKAKARALRVARQQALRAVHPSPKEGLRPEDKAKTTTTMRRSLSGRRPTQRTNPGAGRPQQRIRQVRKPLMGPIGNDVVVLSEWAERVAAIDEVFLALTAAQFRASEAQRVFDSSVI